MNRAYEYCLRKYLYVKSMAPRNKISSMGLVLLLFLAIPAMATTPSATDNVVTRFVWYLAKLAFYGIGGAIVLFGIIIPVGRKILGQRIETNPVANILWALGFLAAPSLLQMGIDWFNADASGSGLLEGMNGLGD